MSTSSKVKVNKRGNAFHISWESIPLNVSVYNKLKYRIIRSNNYGMVQNPSKYIAEIGGGITPGQTIAVRNIIVKDKIIRNYQRMNAIVDEIADKYKKGNGIIHLSQTYDFPPLGLLRGIFLHRGDPSDKIYDLFVGKSDPRDTFLGRDLNQYRAAFQHDAESAFNQKKIAEIAMSNELLVVNYFRSIGISLKDERELAAEQKEEYGRVVITPDILFLDEVYINGTRIHWLDYKDYIGTTVPFLYTSNCAQVKKYSDKWGPGCICYRHSYVEGLTFSEAIITDARMLPIKLV